MKIQYKFSFLLALTLSFLSVTICSYGGELKKSEEKTIQQRTSEDKEETLTHEVITDELVFLVQSAGFRVEDVQLLKDGANATYLKGEKK